jgi:hypothetical protein
VTDQWRRFSYEFKGPEYPTGDYAHIAHGLEVTGPGKVWIDNFVLYRYDDKHEKRPFTPHEVSFDEFMASVPATGRKPAVRFYGPIYHASTAEAMMGNYGNSTWEVAWNMRFGNAPQATLAQCMVWAYRTGDSPERRLRRVDRLGLDKSYNRIRIVPWTKREGLSSCETFARLWTLENATAATYLSGASYRRA